MKKALIAACLVVLATTATACGGSDSGGGGASGPPADASTTEFCQSFKDFYNAMNGLGESASPSEQIKQAKQQVEKVREVGTPQAMSDDARKGYETWTQAILDLSDKGTQTDLDNLGKSFDTTEQKQVGAFFEYGNKTCASQAPSESPS